MKIIKLFAAASAALGFLASCQQQEVENLTNQEELVPVSLTASFNTVETKVSNTETTTDGIKLQPAWKVGDEVIGFDEATPTKNTYTFIVSEVDGSGVATLDGACPSSCTLHLIYLCDTLATSIKNGTLAVSYDNQAGTGDSNNVYTMPAVMLADGTVSDGSGDFHFSNAGTVIGVKAVKGVPNGSTVSKIAVSGEDLSAAAIALDGSSKLALTATLSRPVLIEFPAVGYGSNGVFNYVVSYGLFWSRPLDSSNISSAYYMSFYSNDVNPQSNLYRYFGRSFASRLRIIMDTNFPKPIGQREVDTLSRTKKHSPRALGVQGDFKKGKVLN